MDSDGNELGGVPTVLRDAPLGTYLGWNITSAGFHAGQTCNYVGGMVPFAKTKAQRLATDPRPSLARSYIPSTGTRVVVYYAQWYCIRFPAAQSGFRRFLLRAPVLLASCCADRSVPTFSDPRSQRVYTDKTLTCRDCGASFVFTTGEQEFFASRGFTNEPSRCPECRAARKGRQVGRRCQKPTRRNRGRRACTRFVRVGAFAHDAKS